MNNEDLAGSSKHEIRQYAAGGYDRARCCVDRLKPPVHLICLPQEGFLSAYSNIRFVLGEGNFVLVASEVTTNGAPTAFYDLFRVENGFIAEHWDVIETIPPETEWQNDNGKF